MKCPRCGTMTSSPTCPKCNRALKKPSTNPKTMSFGRRISNVNDDISIEDIEDYTSDD